MPSHPPARGGPSRSRVFAIGAVVTVIACIVGYLALREYIYGDDAPPIPLLDDRGR